MLMVEHSFVMEYLTNNGLGGWALRGPEIVEREIQYQHISNACLPFLIKIHISILKIKIIKLFLWNSCGNHLLFPYCEIQWHLTWPLSGIWHFCPHCFLLLKTLFFTSRIPYTITITSTVMCYSFILGVGAAFSDY